MFKKIFFILFPLIIIFSIYIALQDGHYEVERSKVIKAPVELVYKQLNDLKTWEQWSPWQTRDTSINCAFSEITSGKGAHCSWKDKQGGGYLKTIDAKTNTSLHQEITFNNRGTSQFHWQFDPVDEGNATKVSWGVSGDMGFGEKFFSLFKGKPDENIALTLEDGLEQFDTYLHKIMNIYSITPMGVTEYGGGFFVHLTTTCAFDEISANMDRMLPSVLLYCIGEKYPISGHPFTLYHKYDKKNNIAEFSCCVPVSERVEPKGDFALAFLKRGDYYKTRLKGSYRYMDEAWNKAFEFAASEGKEIDENAKPFEVYVAGHSKYPNPADWITDIYLPLK
jgi:effector-binding domain-containing protein